MLGRHSTNWQTGVANFSLSVEGEAISITIFKDEQLRSSHLLFWPQGEMKRPVSHVHWTVFHRTSKHNYEFPQCTSEFIADTPVIACLISPGQCILAKSIIVWHI